MLGLDAELSLGLDLMILLLDGLGTWWLWEDEGGTWGHWGTGDRVGCILAIDEPQWVHSCSKTAFVLSFTSQPSFYLSSLLMFTVVSGLFT